MGSSASAVGAGAEGLGSGHVQDGPTGASVEEFYDLQNYDSGSDVEEEGGWGLSWGVGVV